MIGDLYLRLYDNCHDQPWYGSCASFVALKGKSFDTCNIRLMLIGRATNGWGTKASSFGSAFAQTAEDQFTSTGRFDEWIDFRDSVMYSRNDSDYCIDRTPFWAYAQEVWRTLGGVQGQDEPIWMNQIVWSNLYKLAPKSSGNPTDDMIEKQHDICVDILKYELSTLKPTHILMMTGYNWFSPFSGIFSDSHKLGVNRMRGKNRNQIFVEGTADFHGIPAVITCRPEYRNKTLFVQQVVEAFSRT